jgi:hypothetical protein
VVSILISNPTTTIEDWENYENSLVEDDRMQDSGHVSYNVTKVYCLPTQLVHYKQSYLWAYLSSMA